MSEDYLWDKSGKDTEIERLEDALKAFRYCETAAPELPAKVFSLKKEKPRWSFKLSFAFAAFAVLAIVFAGIRFQFPDDKIEVAAIDLEINALPIIEETSVEPSFSNADRLGGCRECVPHSSRRVSRPRVGGRDARRTVAGTTALRLIRKSATIENRDSLTAENSKIKKATIKLTVGEKYAYDQLMLALSITSSKLRLVTDKIDAIEKQDAVRENER